MDLCADWYQRRNPGALAEGAGGGVITQWQTLDSRPDTTMRTTTMIEETPDTPDTPELRRHWGTFLQTVRWAHFVTLTTTDIVSTDRLRRDFVHRYIRRLARDAQRGVGWFYAIEHHADGERAHIHALIANTEKLTIASLERPWILGNCRALIYDPCRRASHYVSKYLGRNPELYDLSRRDLPRGVLNVDAQEAA